MGKGSKFTARDVARIICEAKRDSGATEREIIDLCPCWQDPTPSAGLPPPEIPRSYGAMSLLEMRWYSNTGPDVQYCAGSGMRWNNDMSESSMLIDRPQQLTPNVFFPTTFVDVNAFYNNNVETDLWRGSFAGSAGIVTTTWQNVNTWPWSLVVVGRIPKAKWFGWRCGAFVTTRSPKDFDLFLNGSLILSSRGNAAWAVETYKWWEIP